ncbi:hypothetical protein ACOMHN_008212 [Nucella lapillus]
MKDVGGLRAVLQEHELQQRTLTAVHLMGGGHRPRGRPKLRYKDTLKKSLQKCDIDEKRWEFLATNRSEWRQAIRKGTEAYENERQVSQAEKRAASKVGLNCAERTIKCPLCSRLCASDFGLRSHMRVHK